MGRFFRLEFARAAPLCHDATALETMLATLRSTEAILFSFQKRVVPRKLSTFTPEAFSTFRIYFRCTTMNMAEVQISGADPLLERE